MVPWAALIIWRGGAASRIGALAGRAHNVDMPARVLIVDDHPSFRSSARLLLEAEGYEVVGEAADAAEAIRCASELNPDVVLLDVALPDLDGFECASRLTRNGHAPAVILVSSRDWSDLDTHIRRSGARGFISKSELSGAAVEALLP